MEGLKWANSGVRPYTGLKVFQRLFMNLNPFQIGTLLVPHRLILAPMCGITLKPFRQVCKTFGAGLVFNQMVSARALLIGDKKSLHLLDFDESERPVGLQVFGNDADTLAESAKILEEQKPDIIDLNLGCPAKKIVNDGGGSALMSEPEKLLKIIRKMRKVIQKNFTIKIRAGWNEKSKNAIDIAKMAEAEGVNAIAIHARTRAQGYSGKSDWDFIKTLKEKLAIPLIGNGDVKTAADAKRMMQETGCDAVMTGRGAFETPWIFRDFLTGQQTVLNLQEKKRIILKHYELAIAYHGELTGIKMMRKHLCAYTKGLPCGAEFRNRIVRLSDLKEIKKAIQIFFAPHSAIDANTDLSL